jgi:hypothetical protein
VEKLSSLLPLLEARLREFGAPIAEAFRPGAAPERIREALAAAGLHAHEDLLVSSGWRRRRCAVAAVLSRRAG